MLKTTLTTVKKVCVFTLVPRIWKDRVRKGKFDRLPTVLTTVEKSSDSRDKDGDSKYKEEKEREKAQRIIDYTFGNGEYPADIIAEFHKVLIAELKRERLMNQELRRLREELALQTNSEDKSCYSNIHTEENNLLTSTTNKDTHKNNTENLIQKLEKIEEVPLVESEPSNLEDVDDLKTTPPLLGHKCEYQMDDKFLKNDIPKPNYLTAADIADTIKDLTIKPGPCMNTVDTNLKPCHAEYEKQVTVFFSDPKRKRTEFSSPEYGDVTKVTLTEREEALVREIEKVAIKQKTPISPATEESDEDIFRHCSEKAQNESLTDTNEYKSQINTEQQSGSEEYPRKNDRSQNSALEYLFSRIDQHKNYYYAFQIDGKTQDGLFGQKYVNENNDKREKTQPHVADLQFQDEETRGKKTIDVSKVSPNVTLHFKEPFTQNESSVAKWLEPKDPLTEPFYEKKVQKSKFNNTHNLSASNRDGYIATPLLSTSKECFVEFKPTVTDGRNHQTEYGNHHTSHDMHSKNAEINIPTSQNLSTKNDIPANTEMSGGMSVKTEEDGEKLDRLNATPTSIEKLDKTKASEISNLHENYTKYYNYKPLTLQVNETNLHSIDDINNTASNEKNNIVTSSEPTSYTSTSTMNPKSQHIFDNWYQKQSITRAHLELLRGHMTTPSFSNTEFRNDQNLKPTSVPLNQLTSNEQICNTRVAKKDPVGEVSNDQNRVFYNEQSNAYNIPSNPQNYNVTSDGQTICPSTGTMTPNKLNNLQPNERNDLYNMLSNQEYYMPPNKQIIPTCQKNSQFNEQNNSYNMPSNQQNHSLLNEQSIPSNPQNCKVTSEGQTIYPNNETMTKNNLNNSVSNEQNNLYNAPSNQQNYSLPNKHSNTYSKSIEPQNYDITSDGKTIYSTAETMTLNNLNNLQSNEQNNAYNKHFNQKHFLHSKEQNNTVYYYIPSNQPNYKLTSNGQVYSKTTSSKSQDLDGMVSISICQISNNTQGGKIPTNQVPTKETEKSDALDIILNKQNQNLISNQEAIDKTLNTGELRTDISKSNLYNLQSHEQNDIPLDQQNDTATLNIDKTAALSLKQSDSVWSEMLRVAKEQLDYLQQQSKHFCYDRNRPFIPTQNYFQSEPLVTNDSRNKTKEYLDAKSENLATQSINSVTAEGSIKNPLNSGYNVQNVDISSVMRSSPTEKSETDILPSGHIPSRETKEYYNNMNQLHHYGNTSPYSRKSRNNINWLQAYKNLNRNQNVSEKYSQSKTKETLDSKITNSNNPRNEIQNINKSNITHSVTTEKYRTVPNHQAHATLNQIIENKSTIKTTSVPEVNEIQPVNESEKHQEALKHKYTQSHYLVEKQDSPSRDMPSKSSSNTNILNENQSINFGYGEIYLDTVSPTETTNTEHYVYRNCNPMVPVKQNESLTTEKNQLSDRIHNHTSDLKHKLDDLHIENEYHKLAKPHRIQLKNKNMGKLSDIWHENKNNDTKRGPTMVTRFGKYESKTVMARAQTKNVKQKNKVVKSHPVYYVSKYARVLDSKRMIDEEDEPPKPRSGTNLSSSPINTSAVMTAARIQQLNPSNTDCPLAKIDTLLSVQHCPRYYERLGRLLDAMKSHNKSNLKEIVREFTQSDPAKTWIKNGPKMQSTDSPDLPTYFQAFNNKPFNAPNFEINRTDATSFKIDGKASYYYPDENIPKYHERLAHLIKLTKHIERSKYKHNDAQEKQYKIEKKFENPGTTDETLKDYFKIEHIEENKSNMVKLLESQNKEDADKSSCSASDSVDMKVQNTNAIHENNKQHLSDLYQSNKLKSDLTGGEITLTREKSENTLLDGNEIDPKSKKFQSNRIAKMQNSTLNGSIENYSKQLQTQKTSSQQQYFINPVSVNTEHHINQTPKLEAANKIDEKENHDRDQVDSISEKVQVNIAANVGPLPELKDKSDVDLTMLLASIRTRNHLETLEELKTNSGPEDKTAKDPIGLKTDFVPEDKTKEDPIGKCGDPKRCPPPRSPECKPNKPESPKPSPPGPKNEPPPCPPPKCPPPCIPPRTWSTCTPKKRCVGVSEWQKYPEIILKEIYSFSNIRPTVGTTPSDCGVDISQANSNEGASKSCIQLLRGTRTYEPWTPMPSWPVPAKYKRSPFQTKCPKANPKPCLTEPPCKGFPKRLTCSLADLNAEFA